MSTALVCDFKHLARGDVALVGGKISSLGEMISRLASQGIPVPPGKLVVCWRNGRPGARPLPRRAGQSVDCSSAASGRLMRRPPSPPPTRSSRPRLGLITCLLPSGPARRLRIFLTLALPASWSLGVQQMVRSDAGGSGVMFSIDTESGFDKVVLINAAWGLGEKIVQGTVNPDEYQVFKPLVNDTGLVPIIQKKLGGKATKMVLGRSRHQPTRNVPTSKAERAAFVLTDDEILALARLACTIEKHYGCGMDMEWAKDGITGELFIVQARPETVHSRQDPAVLKTYSVKKKGRALATGLSIGDAAVAGHLCLIEDAKDIDRFIDGSILVTVATDPDWVPIMKRAAAIITDHGGRTSHAAIVSRELGVPAVVGTGDATYVLHTDQEVTVSCAEGDVGFVYEGVSDITTTTVDLTDLPPVRTNIIPNLANPSAAYRWWRLPADGIGLARMEPNRQADGWVPPQTGLLCRQARPRPGGLCATFFPRPTIIRLSDFKTNVYAGLIGGAEFEPLGENPMLGFRGASRDYSPRYRDGFALECRAIKQLREVMGFTNAVVMVPFCRTVDEAKKVLDVMAENGLRCGEGGLKVYVMCEIPSNVILAERFTEHFDGFSIGSNDLTQLTLGVDRDSGLLADLFDEQDEAVKWMIARVIRVARERGSKVGICEQAPSDHPEFARFLVQAGIDSISVIPDSFLAVKRHVVDSESPEHSLRRYVCKTCIYSSSPHFLSVSSIVLFSRCADLAMAAFSSLPSGISIVFMIPFLPRTTGRLKQQSNSGWKWLTGLTSLLSKRIEAQILATTDPVPNGVAPLVVKMVSALSLHSFASS
ncbi:uncharacterized protein PODANS_4_2250 [Podospora anserina S mat+]|uniref:pyruvate, water dikinase n=1 Tax=Podospora anserina (strain S / ATCC MYA-4624 / DSM 980 / FGSC 10383) TaxID=515849 RepID=B2ADW2_PODAN|nr:uncharacterized protein PODANS_4_2250 [Podospora anserina S mat+]CAP61627.1 unnamed protein product [Podospora anserina S mat+]CDP27981.1 Putative Phosphoenolpyruvate synthase [Podospora anserina S mat+]